MFNDGLPVSTEVFQAFNAFTQAGFDVQTFVSHATLPLDPERVTVGGVATVLGQLRRLGIEVVDEDYPPSLWRWTTTMGAPPLETTFGEVRARRVPWPLFVKPSKGHKTFTGQPIRAVDDLLTLTRVHDDEPVWVMPYVDFTEHREWRCFFIYDEVVDVRPYRGPHSAPAPYPSAVQALFRSWENRPRSGSFDLATSPFYLPTLIEVHRGFSLGSYGMFDHLYAKLLCATWAELTGTAMAWTGS